jgi:hypothetical protein
MDCSDCLDFYKERKQETPCDSCPINWLNKEAESMGIKCSSLSEKTIPSDKQ